MTFFADYARKPLKKFVTNISFGESLDLTIDSFHLTFSCISFINVIYYLNQFGWHCEAYCTVCLPPSHLRRGISGLVAGNIQIDILGALKARDARIVKIGTRAFDTAEFKRQEIILTSLLKIV